jgi:hypothetical protein
MMSIKFIILPVWKARSRTRFFVWRLLLIFSRTTNNYSNNTVYYHFILEKMTILYALVARGKTVLAECMILSI